MFLLILVSALSICAVALPKDKVDAVTMESYEQNWDDNVGTIALKNNTNQDIYNVTFQLIYLDMSGKQLDYEEFSQNVDIAPGMTKKINITAYESSRDYSYYKSEAEYLHPKRFKIKFKLIAYNSATSQTGDEYDNATPTYQSHPFNNNPSGSGWESLLLILLLIIIAAAFYAPLIILARNYGRSVSLCILLSFFTTPIAVIIILLIIGKKNEPPQNRY